MIHLTCCFRTWRIDLDMAMASTGTTDPISKPVSKGVTMADVIVVVLVSRILKATSPLLKKLA